MDLLRITMAARNEVTTFKSDSITRAQLPIEMVLGHSGSSVQHAIVKTGPLDEIRQEARHLRSLPPEIAPHVYYCYQSDVDKGVLVMEHVNAVPEDDLLYYAVRVLSDVVWNRDPPLFFEINWMDAFRERFGFEPPSWVYENEPFCLIHGDPTLANLRYDGLKLKFIDPKTPSNGIPPFRGVDLGKIMQSMMGWERALIWFSGRQVENRLDEMYYSRMQYYPFADLIEPDVRKAVFWCMVHFMRIVKREQKSNLGIWASNQILHLAEELEMVNEARLGLGRCFGDDSGGHKASLSVIRR